MFHSPWLLTGLLPAVLMLTGCQSTPVSENSPTRTGPARVDDGAPSAESDGGTLAVVFVKGLSCPLCATAIDKELLRVAGVTGVQTNFHTGEVRVKLQADALPSAEALEQAVKLAGFTVDRIELPTAGG